MVTSSDIATVGNEAKPMDSGAGESDGMQVTEGAAGSQRRMLRVSLATRSTVVIQAERDE